MSAPRILLLGLSAVLAACAAKKPPPPQRVTLGESNVEYRDYTLVKGSLCDADPRRLAPELQKINELLDGFVSKTEGASAPDATAEQVELLRQGSQALGPVVEAHRKNLTGLRTCDFKQAPFPELIKQGDEVISKAKARLDEAPAVLIAADQRLAEKKWMEESAVRETTAKQTWCAANTAVGTGDLFFARQSPDGMTRWLFCDGMMVEAPAGGESTLIIPETISKRERRRIQEKRYLEAAKSYPVQEIDKLGAERKPEASP